MPKRQLSAKDKAFQEERMRLMKQAETYRQLVITRDGQLYEAEKEIKKLKEDIALLESKIGVSTEELRKHMAQTASLNAMLKPLADMMRGIY